MTISFSLIFTVVRYVVVLAGGVVLGYWLRNRSIASKVVATVASVVPPASK